MLFSLSFDDLKRDGYYDYINFHSESFLHPTFYVVWLYYFDVIVNQLSGNMHSRNSEFLVFLL
jgi:hypothetical protein